MDEDFVVEPENESHPTNIEDLGGVPNCMEKYCLLCKYGSTDGVETDTHVNTHIKLLETAIEQGRKSLSRSKLVSFTKSAYEAYIKDHDDFLEEPEWEDDTIEEHLFVHEAGLIASRGQSITGFVLEDLLIATKHSMNHVSF
jgi:hypothetical protein